MRRHRQLTIVLAVALIATLALGALWTYPSREPFPVGTTADVLVLEKAKHTLSVYSRGAILRTYQVSPGRAGLDAKQREGIGAPPKADTSSIGTIQPAGSTKRFMCPI